MDRTLILNDDLTNFRAPWLGEVDLSQAVEDYAHERLYHRRAAIVSEMHLQ